MRSHYTVVYYVIFLSLLTSEIVCNREGKKEISHSDLEADTHPGRWETVPGSFSRARGLKLKWWSLGPCSQGGGLVFPTDWMHLPSSVLPPRAHPPSSGAGSEQGQPRWWSCTQQRQQFAVEITGDSRIQEPGLSLHQYRGLPSQPQFLKAARGSRKHPRPGLPWWPRG